MNRQYSGIRIKASSLVEVTTAMIIISMVYGTAVLIYLQAQRSVIQWQKLNASVKADNLCTQVMKDSVIRTDDRQIEFDEYDIRLQVTRSDQGKNLWMVKVGAFTKEGLVLVEKRHLIFKEE